MRIQHHIVRTHLLEAAAGGGEVGSGGDGGGDDARGVGSRAEAAGALRRARGGACQRTANLPPV